METHPHARLIERFYEAFGRRDAATMNACYAADVHFSDPVFRDLHGDDARAMWTMLCEQAKDLRIEASEIRADDTSGSARWDAWYTFSVTGRKVHNVIQARFELRDGQIVRHADTFDLWKWTGMALGPVGKLLGWSPLIQGAVRKKAAAGLRAWRAKRP